MMNSHKIGKESESVGNSASRNKVFVYLAKPKYGGWVTFTAHLLNGLGIHDLYKIGSKVENRKRGFGYGLAYQNIPWEAVRVLSNKHDNLVVLALDKHGRELIGMDEIANGHGKRTVIIHDTIEIRKQEYADALKDGKWNIITIRQKITDYIADRFGLESTPLLHPFYGQVHTHLEKIPGTGVSTCRVDFDKHQEMILDANRMLGGTAIEIYGALNRMYAFHKLDDNEFNRAYRGTYPQNFDAVANIMKWKQFAIDLTYIDGDGGGTQYSFLEAIANDCVLVLNRKWINSVDERYRVFIEGHNCLAVSDGQELAYSVVGNKELVQDSTGILKNIRENARTEILQKNIDAIKDWNQALFGSSVSG